MNTPRLRPLIYKDTCDKHGETGFIVEQQDFNFKKKKVTFVFYCKKCWLEYSVKNLQHLTPAWQTSMTLDEYNGYFGFNYGIDN